ncbi:hypothetical protein HNP99_003560 [Flavobacterium sp. 28A]|uniref:hypothetical protein n=1 Tax=Flavobacterium sp. 28A TaxID=2735895 RepID=UPI00156D5F88|nr:hypothetical protein [Flavobacterium sp. 28A]NRT17181.1 hypothetical protein [Flavobacterium sp. 28A]
MTIDKKILQTKILEKLKDNYQSKIIDSEYITFKTNKNSIDIEFSFRIQFYNRISFEGFKICLIEIEDKIYPLILKELNNFYSKYFGISFMRFYKPEIEFSIYEINNEEDINLYLNHVIQCLEYHEKEVFPKLLDINFLAEYVGSVPFENQLEIPVGGKYPVSLFKKLAVLKWGGEEEKYMLYKKGLAEFIEEDFKDPKYGDEAPTYKKGYLKLIKHLENEPNPLKKNNIC